MAEKITHAQVRSMVCDSVAGIRPFLRHERDAVIGLIEAAALFAQTRGWSEAKFRRYCRAAFRAAAHADALRRRLAGRLVTPTGQSLN